MVQHPAARMQTFITQPPQFICAPYPEGMVPVKWPNGQMLRHFASLVFGCDLCYSARPGDPVTLFTAREGLKVETTAAGGASVPGVLVRPERIRGHAVLWQVKLFRPPPNTVTYAVEASRSTPSSAPTESGSPDVAELRVSAGGIGTRLRAGYRRSK